MTVWKYPLDVVGEQKIRTPATWKPLHVEHQDGLLMLWAAVEPDGEQVLRTIVIVGTGHLFDAEGLTHIGSAINHARGLVWHVYLSEPTVAEETAAEDDLIGWRTEEKLTAWRA